MNTRIRFSLVLSLLCLTPASLSAQGAAITGLSLSEGTLGTVLDILGSGFGQKKPKVFLSTLTGEKVKKTSVKVVSNDEGGGTTTILIKKALLGTFKLMLQPKGGDPVLSDDTFEIVGPTVQDVSPGEAEVKGLVTLTVAQASSKKGKVTLGGLKAKVVSQTANEGVTPTSTVVVKLPSTLATGTWEVTFANKVGQDTAHQAVSVSGAKKEKLPKPRMSAAVDDSTFVSKGKKVDATLADGVLTISGVGKFDGATGTLRLGLPDSAATDDLPAQYVADPAALTFETVDKSDVSTVWTADDDGFTIYVNVRVGSLVAGSFEGTLLRTSGEADPETRVVEGSFIGELIVES
ncbi:MAG: hypothetical protein H6825_02785 [Planctomycetes bacterium]|nr:hypothetical protein [Planctomycetota bacterium]